MSRLLDDGARVVDLSADFRLDAADLRRLVSAAPLPRAAAAGGLRPDRAAASRPLAGADARGQPGLLPHRRAARPGAACAAGPARRRDRRQVGRERRRQVAQRAHPLLQRRRRPRAPTPWAGTVTTPRSPPAWLRWPARGGGAGRSRSGAAGADRRARPAGRPALTFVPHLMPVARGIVETIYVRAARLPSAAALRALYDEAYAGEPFVAVATRRPSSRTWSARNGCRLFATIDERGAPHHRGRGHRQPHEGRRRSGRAEPERHGRLSRALGAHVNAPRKTTAASHKPGPSCAVAESGAAARAGADQGRAPRKGPASAMRLPLEGCGPSELLPTSRFVNLPAGVEQAGGSVTHPLRLPRRRPARRPQAERPAATSASSSPTGRARRPCCSPRTPRRPRRCASPGARRRASACAAWSSTRATPTPAPASAAWATRRACACVAADALRLPPEEVAVASTGVIGVPLPIEPIVTGIEAAAKALVRRRRPRLRRRHPHHRPHAQGRRAHAPPGRRRACA